MNTQEMYGISKSCMDILVDKEGFPDFVFVLYDEGYLTHHVVIERREGRAARFCARRDGEPVQSGDFNREFVDKVYSAIEELNDEGYFGQNRNTNDLGVVPFGKREAEVLLLGTVAGNSEFQDGVRVKTLDYRYTPGKHIKIYSTPHLIISGI